MPAYRLVADHGYPAAGFDDTDDDTAERRARNLSAATATAKATGFRLERLMTGDRETGTWVTVAAWMPRRVRDHPGGLTDVITPRSSTHTPGLVGIDINDSEDIDDIDWADNDPAEPASTDRTDADGRDLQIHDGAGDPSASRPGQA